MIRTAYRIALMFVAGLAFGTVFALMAVSARASAPEGYHAPSAANAIRVEGAWRVGFRVVGSDSTVSMLDPAPAMIQRQCGRGTDAARACRVEWRGYYNILRAVRDANPNGPDYWPFPG